MLKLKEEKTELIVLKSRTFEDIQLQEGEKTAYVAESVKNLGVYFETFLPIDKQVNAMSKALLYYS